MAQKENPTLKALTDQGFRFKKELGQHFLFHTLVLEQIADAAQVAAGDLVMEAGAGAGSLTAVLASRGARVKAIELDRSLTPFLRRRFQAESKVDIIQGDVMKLDLDALARDAFRADALAADMAAGVDTAAGINGFVRPQRPDVPYKLVANLPYNISTALVTKVFRHLRGPAAGALLLQKEVADKITACPGQEGYGLLSLAAAWYGRVWQVTTLGPEYFTPRPAVDSALIAFQRERPELGVEEGALWLLIRGLFNMRRKNLLNGLKALGAFRPRQGQSWAEVPAAAGIDPGRRPETLSLPEFAALVRAAGYKA